jgi:predicted small secreted protein
MRKFLILLLLSVVLFVVGCQTVEGIGKDLQWAGQLRSQPQATK